MKDLRPAVIKLHQKGLTKTEISNLLDLPLTTVWDDIKRFEETGTNKDRPGRRRKRSARTKKNRQRIWGMIRRNPSSKVNSARKLGQKTGISDRSVRRILHEDLGMKPYKLKKRQNLSEEIKEKRLKRSKALLRRFSGNRHRSIVFSDEKVFDTEQVSVFSGSP